MTKRKFAGYTILFENGEQFKKTYNNAHSFNEIINYVTAFCKKNNIPSFDLKRIYMLNVNSGRWE